MKSAIKLKKIIEASVTEIETVPESLFCMYVAIEKSTKHFRNKPFSLFPGYCIGAQWLQRGILKCRNWMELRGALL